ncbi:MAG: universal stress protein [Candidatus Hydrothermarchaeaceae archaeon]
MIERILLPTDGSAFSERAADYAIGIAKNFKATLMAVHVVEMSAPKQLDVTSLEPEAARRAGTCFESIMEKAADASIDVETKVLISRSIGEALLEEIEEGNYDLVVMGSHGLSGVKKFLLGSVSEAVVHHTTKPVLLIK